MKKLLIFVIFFVTSCGYQPIHINKNNSELVFKKLELVGDKEINRRIVSFIKINEDKNNKKLSNLILVSNENIIETSKDEKGRVSTLKTTVEIRLSIESDNQVTETKTFKESFSYNNKNNKFDLTKYQSEVKNNLVDKIIEKMNIYFSLR
tara:strand:- start:935 stop:1384 length:450 start_codon:yes stop_codon:yes gene_type:complete